jgi:hypothetical protein
MPQKTNLNVPPYFDDFSDLKNYQKVLFKPGYPIQARELTTLQSILQNQIEKFGNHFFKEGSMVIPGQIAYDSEYTSVQIDETHLGLPISLYIENLVGKLIQGENSGVKAKIENFIKKNGEDVENNTLYIKYQSSSDTNFSTTTFIDGENLIALEDISYSLSNIRSGNSFATTIISNSTSTGSAAKIADGVYFIRGFFLKVNSETLILDYYTNNPSYRVGLSIVEEIVVASDDYKDLFDNANGFSNYAAPGADRLNISASLIKKSIDDFNDENFIELLRLENGILQKFVKTTSYNLIRDEFARRTYDESGDYYVKPFEISTKECLNDKIGNNGIYSKNKRTNQGNTASDDLMCLSISPGKAYIRGYEIETINNTIIDLEKPRSTKNDFNQAIPFSLGRQLLINNTYGSVNVGFGTSSLVDLHQGRTATAGVSSDSKIGVARVYDYKLKNTEYQNQTTQYELSLYDVQTFTDLTLNTTITQTIPAYIKGKNSGASGYLFNSVSTSDLLKLYQVSGTFVRNEQIEINGITDSRTIKLVRDYNFSDVHQIVGNGVSFTADPLLSNEILLSTPGSQFTISASSGGISTVTTSNSNFYVGINTGDVVSYTKQGETVPTFNKVNQISTTLKNIKIVSLPSVSGVCNGTLPSSNITVNDFKKVTLDITNSTKNISLYSKLNKFNISNLDLTGSDLIIRKSYNVTISNNGLSQLLETDPNLTLEPFDEEDYNLAFVDGTVESLTDQKLIISGRTVTLQNISQNGKAILTATFKKINIKPKNKIYNRCSSLIVNKSILEGSGIGSTTLNDGLVYSNVYGIRVQDKEISLNVPDVIEIVAIIESSNTSDPTLPFIQLTNLSSNILNSIRGELIVGQTSGAVATLISSSGTNQVDIVYKNENIFSPNESVVFQETNIQANVLFAFPGDKNIKNNYFFDSGQKSDYLDFSKIIRKSQFSPPTKKIKIIYDNFTINSSDTGDFIAVNSYDINIYKKLQTVDGLRVSDIIDCRPRVLPFSGSTYSPFEFSSRIFDPTTNSSTNIFAKNKNINLSYDYYVPRIDKIFLDKDGAFIVNKGVPSLEPKTPNTLDSSLEIGTVYLPAYVFDVSNVKINLVSHKRYRMKDISSLDQRLSNVEYYTSLSLLESDTQNLTIRDRTTQLDRFKCGFFVDNFKSYNGGDISNPAYRASVDISVGELNPQPYTTSLDLLIGSDSVIGIGTSSNVNTDLRFVTDLGSPNIRRVGSVVCLNYSDVEYVKNKYATRTENVNPFNVINWIGSIQLSPSSDTWIETRRSQRTADIEGSYNSFIQQLGVDTNTGLSPIDWGSWETNWTGSQRSRSPVFFSSQTGSELISQTDSSGGFVPGSGIPITTTQTFRDSFINFSNETTTTTTNQSRQGIQFGISERFDTTNLGDRVVSREILVNMRSRNIEILARRMKPNTRFYAFFDNVDVTSYVTPKLLEVTMISGTFSAGETVVGSLGSRTFRCRLANQNHKYGPYNSPQQTYSTDPYNPSNSLSSQYSSTTKLLNIDTASLEIQSSSNFYGQAVVNMRLTGQSSGAICDVKDLRLISDSAGTLIASFFIPDPTTPSTPAFTSGTKTFKLTSSDVNSTISGFSESTAESNFTSNGTLDNIEATTLRIRNADISRNARTDNRQTTETDTRVVVDTSFTNRTVTNSRWVDPLAQSFEVADANGVYITKCDIFFRSKSTNNIPVTLQVRTMSTGLPTQTILPFGEVVLEPSQISLSEDGSVPTSFIFPSPVYLETGNAYSIVLLSASDQYNVWISRMGEPEVSTSSKSESERIIVAQQPLLGSLFKSQNGATWDPSQYEDLKFTLYRANFTTNSSNIRFYNPTLDVGNNQIVSLRQNPIQMYSNSTLVGIGTSIQQLAKGVRITQKNNPNFSANLNKVLGGISTGTTGTLTITNSGIGYTTGPITYSNVDLITITGNGIGAKANLSVSGGIAIAATVTNSGIGYGAGDALTISYTNTGGLGKNLILTVPNVAGIITSVNSLILENIQGTIDTTDSNKFIQYTGTSGITTILGGNATSVTSISTGLKFKVNHNNHGMYFPQNQVTLSGIESDVPPVRLSSDYSSSSTDAIVVNDVNNFINFENIPVGVANTGYVIIKDEIIGYTGVNTSIKSLTGIIRGTLPSSYVSNEIVSKYELNGVSLKRINKTHTISSSDSIDLDEYTIELKPSESGVNRSTGNPGGYPALYFNETKSGGSYQTLLPIKSNSKGPKATQNIQFNIIKPNVQTLIPPTTSLSCKIRTFSGRSVGGNENPYVDQGFEDISLTSDHVLSSPRIIASEVNEKTNLTAYPGSKSFTMEIQFSTGDPKVSPMIDLDRVNVITVMSRLNNPITNYSTDSRVNSIFDDPHAAIYVSKTINLKQSSDSIKVLFEAFRHASSDIRVMYKLLRTDSTYQQQFFELFPGYDNLDNNGFVIDSKNNSGRSDKFILPSNNISDFGSYEFTADNLPLFNGLQIKILMSGTNQALYPRIKDLRVIATKS